MPYWTWSSFFILFFLNFLNLYLKRISRFLHVLNEFTPERQFCSIPDISYGEENVPVSCVNSIDNAYPEYVEYSTVRYENKNIFIGTK